jgi:hypothetical protein
LRRPWSAVENLANERANRTDFPKRICMKQSRGMRYEGALLLANLQWITNSQEMETSNVAILPQ